MKSFAPWHYYLKVAIILGASWALEFYIHYTASYVWYLMVPLGFLFALIGNFVFKFGIILNDPLKITAFEHLPLQTVSF